MNTGHWPKLGYVVLWFPKPSETFIFREVSELRRMGFPVEVFTHYARLKRWVSPDMKAYPGPVTRLGTRALTRFPGDILYWFRRDPKAALKVLTTAPFRRWRSLEITGESLWGVLCGFTFARLFVERGIEHIHADWASGAATAAWTAHLLTGLPFSFTGRAADIFPPDGALVEKAQACSFIRTDVGRNVEYLMREGRIPREKIQLIYAAMTMKNVQTAPLAFQKPYKLLALGRFVEKKGFDVLLQACALLQQQGVDFELTLAGDGGLARALKRQAAELGLTERVHFPGFLSHDQVPAQLMRTDVFVMPCKVSGTGDRDGIPNVIMEALSYRLPVVSTDVSGIGEVVIDNETGVLVQQKDATALAAGIKRLLDDRQLALRLAENGRKLVYERFDPQNVARQLAEMFSKKKS